MTPNPERTVRGLAHPPRPLPRVVEVQEAALHHALHRLARRGLVEATAEPASTG